MSARRLVGSLGSWLSWRRASGALVLALGASCAGCGGGDPVADAGVDAPTVAEDAPSDAGVDAARDAAPEGPLVPAQLCPGPGCETNSGMLEAGASAVAFTPEAGSYDLILGPDGMPDDDPDYSPAGDGDSIEDTNGNGRDDPAWIAGFGMGRGANGVRNDQWARALALRNGDTTIVFCVIDSVGYMINHMDLVRAMVPAELGVDYVFMAATHVHEARDTVGIWGADVSSSGLDPDFMRLVQERAAQAIREAVARLAPARVEMVSFHLGEVDLDPAMPGVQAETRRFFGDNRDPYILDDQIRMMRFVTADGSMAPSTPPTPDASGSRAPAGQSTSTIATWINFAAHPEYEGSDQRLLSGDIGHWVRTTIENGADGPDADTDPDVPGVGGIALFWNGAVGVQIGPNHIEPQEWDGTPVPDDSPEQSENVGSHLGYWALRALDGSGDFPVRRTELDASAVPLSFRRARFFVRIQNTAYHIAFRSGLFDRDVYNYDPARPISFTRNTNIPEAETELAVIRIGPAQLFTMPGELDPMLFVGTRGDRAHTPPSYNGGDPVVASAENPPEIPAEEIPHVLELRDTDVDSEDVWLLGLTDDFLGYFVPDFDYELSAGVPFLTEAPGHHYEETNSIGPEGWPRIWGKLEELVGYTP
ncbi:MAG: hypothetical protein K1X94_16855 [Sandaracinaceae bacterium]|nr:hypothetical protein [Sandaracinaceae bacterium]